MSLLAHFLSGGIDSSLVTAIAQEVNNSQINTFSIGFEDKNTMKANMQK